MLRADAVRFSLSEATQVKSTNESIPNFSLLRNYPNPFNNATIIQFNVPAATGSQGQYVELKVFDILGNEIATLVNGWKTPGRYQISFEGNNFASGIYFCRMKSDNTVKINKMILMK